jgi:DNA polymerase III sliding clamp (beta) subunit (PCNA family)
MWGSAKVSEDKQESSRAVINIFYLKRVAELGSEEWVTLRRKERHVLVSCGRSKFKMFDSDVELPKFPLLPDANPIEIEDSKALASSLKECLRFVAKEGTRFTFDAVQLVLPRTGFRCASTDGRRLLVCGPKDASGKAILIYSAQVRSILRTLNGGSASIRLDKNLSSISCGGMTSIFSPCDGIFPRIEDVIRFGESRSFAHVESGFATAVRQASVMASIGAKIAISTSDAGLVLSHRSFGGALAEESEVEFPCVVSGDDRMVGVSSVFLLDFAKTFGSDFTVTIQKPNEPLIFQKDGMLGLLMPINLK